MTLDNILKMKTEYQPGTRIELLSNMQGEPGMPEGLQGEVDFVDDAGHIHTNWENGSRLAILPDVDKFKKIY